MQKKAFTGGVILVLILGWTLLLPRPLRERALDIHLQAGRADVPAERAVLVVISNASRNPVTYDNGPIVLVACLRNGIWSTNVTGRSVTGSMILAPSTAARSITLNDETLIAKDTEAVKVGLEFTSLSWRGRLAWQLPHGRIPDGIASFLFALDKSKRSRTVWSDILTFDRSSIGSSQSN